jgi:ADP-ribose pyrophosphatase YjhB (NUDIX family)
MVLPDPDPGADADEDGLPLRLAGRVVLLDPRDRVLLMRYDNPTPDDRHWSTPGGGLNPGEDYRAGARRELAEETGWSDIPLLSEVLRQTRIIRFGPQLTRQQERFYLARTDQPAREIRGVEAMHVSDGIVAWRWWTLAELDATGEVVWPSGLADLIRTALSRSGD